MSKWVVDIHGDIEGDYEIIKEYEEPRTGHWIEEKSKVYKCSNCGRYALEWGGQLMMSRYCPNCGAKMAESEEMRDESIHKQS